MDDDTSANEQTVEDEENAESESEKTGTECDVIAEPSEQERSEHEPSEVESETASHTEDVPQDEEGLGTCVEENAPENVERNEDEADEEKETTCEDKVEGDGDGEVDDEKTTEDAEVNQEENEKGKAPFPWMFSMAELYKSQKMLLPEKGVYYPGRIDDIHEPDL